MNRTVYIISILIIILLVACSPKNGETQVASSDTPALIVTENAASATVTSSPETETPQSNPEKSTDVPLRQTETITLTPTEIILSSGPNEYPDDFNPLTGLPFDDLTLLNRRPIAVKIQLYPRNGRPPWGVSLADIVYDYYQNDGLTRLNAIFYSNDAEQVGPIRSARIFDEHIMRMYKTIFAFGGADWRVFNQIYDVDLRELMVVEGAWNCPPMCRIDPNAANYLVTNTEELSKYINEKGVENGSQDLKGMYFNTQIPEDGKAGEQVEVRWSISAYVGWRYDPQYGRYEREQDSIEAGDQLSEQYEPFSDRLTEQQITAENIIVIPLNHIDLYPQNNFEVIDIKLPVGETGIAYAFRDGQVYEVYWNRPEVDSVLYLTYADGSDFPFKPGRTWFEIVGKASKITELEDGLWRFEFRY